MNRCLSVQLEARTILAPRGQYCLRCSSARSCMVWLMAQSAPQQLCWCHQTGTRGCCHPGSPCRPGQWAGSNLMQSHQDKCGKWGGTTPGARRAAGGVCRTVWAGGQQGEHQLAMSPGAKKGTSCGILGCLRRSVTRRLREVRGARGTS